MIRHLIFEVASDKIQKGSKREVNVEDGMFFPLPQEKKGQVNCIYVAAPSGAGKSTFVGNYVKYYKKMYPSRPVFALTRQSPQSPLPFLSSSSTKEWVHS